MSLIDGELFRKKFFALDIEFRPSQIDAVFDCLGDSEIVESSVSCENASEITRKTNASGDLISREETYKVLTDYYHHTTEVQHKVLKDALNRVPSAEPTEQLEKEKEYWHNLANSYGQTIVKLSNIIGNMPSAERVGHWIEDDVTWYKALNARGYFVDEHTPYFVDDVACSECLKKFSVIDNETEQWNYCPNCGARMVSE